MLLAFIIHELDAIKRHEWRILPLTSFMPERIAQKVFIGAHIPLIPLLLLLTIGKTNSSVALGLSAFAIIHIALHYLFRKHPANEFNTPLSLALIILPGIFGAAHLVAYWSSAS